MRMSILLYDGFTTLDIVGGYESLARIPNMRTEFVATEVGIYAADMRALGLYAWKTLEDAKGTDILYVPGGLGVYAAQRDSRILDFIRKSHENDDLDRRHLQRGGPSRRRRRAKGAKSHDELVLQGAPCCLRCRVCPGALSSSWKVCNRGRGFSEH